MMDLCHETIFKTNKNFVSVIVSITLCCKINLTDINCSVKRALSGQRQFLATESPLKVMKNAFYFTSKAFFVLKIFKFLSWLFVHISKRLD